MPKFDSPLGSKQVNNPQTREFTIPDESGFNPPPPSSVRPQRPHAPPVFDEGAMREFNARMQPPPPPTMREQSEMEREMLEAKRAKREGKERLSDGARRRIEMLIGMTRLTKDIDIGGNLYRVRTLTSKELREALVATGRYEGVEFIFESRKQVLARCLTIVAGVEVDQFIGSPYLEDRLDFVEDMDHALLIRLFNEYNLLANEAQDKYAPKNEAEVREVLEDLKK
jgi:hypothetical protein